MRISFLARRQEQRVVYEWIRDELKLYADNKFNDASWWQVEGDDVHTREGVGRDSWWLRQIEQYIGRADTLGLNTPQGRQALFKACTTTIGLLQSVVRVYGPPPPGGLPSGQLTKDEE